MKDLRQFNSRRVSVHSSLMCLLSTRRKKKFVPQHHFCWDSSTLKIRLSTEPIFDYFVLHFSVYFHTLSRTPSNTLEANTLFALFDFHSKFSNIFITKYMEIATKETNIKRWFVRCGSVAKSPVGWFLLFVLFFFVIKKETNSPSLLWGILCTHKQFR